MKAARLFAVSVVITVFASACSSANGSAPSVVPAVSNPAPSLVQQSNVAQSCATLLPGDEVRCFALFRTDAGAAISSDARQAMSVSVAGYGPSDIRAAYALPYSAGSGQTVAVVDAYDAPHAESDMRVYRAHFGLPSCTTANGCFKKLNQSGVQGKYPVSNGGWAQEISLDLDMISAACPRCHILLIEANNATFANLGAAVNTAIRYGAGVVSNSYGGSEFAASDSAYSHARRVIVASAGDNGYGATQPCSFATVVCVGGTTLTRSSTARGWSESVWSGTGSGCSALVSKPVWQKDTLCRTRSESDVAAIADPDTGVAVYDSTLYDGIYGWQEFGGTSVSSPIVAAAFALAGNEASMNGAQSIWQHGGSSSLYDVTSGSNGACSSTYICRARVGYDGPTGWGTAHGLSAL